ncbi:MAG: histidine kinase [Pseudanabaena sp. CAN_BIN31]|nr:histidine kinase [Pseudanabaena sp. CAN_BIN31]
MSEPIKQKINANLEKVKGTGKLRIENIREIVRDAVSQTIAELKEGSGEIGLIIKEAISTMLGDLRLRQQHDPEEITASIEGAIEGGTSQRQQEIAQQRARLQSIQAQIDERQKQLDREIGDVLTDLDTANHEDSMKTAINTAVYNVRENQDSGVLQQQYLKLKSQLESLDERLLDRYGDRYIEVKHKWENAKTWYEKTKTEAEASGTLPLHQKQSEIEHNFGELGTVVARKEQEVKEHLQEIWQGKTSER